MKILSIIQEMKNQKMKVNLLFLLSILFSISKLYGQTKTFTDDRSGVEIIFSSEDPIFPQSWYDTPSNAIIETIESDDDISRSLMIIKKALKKYPVDVLKSNLRKVYILYDIKFYNVGYGGTYWEDNVYITNQGISNGYDDIFIEQLFHAEFSSILYLNYKQYFDKKAWKAANAPDVEYGNGGYDAIKSGVDSEDFDEVINNQGFLTQYGMSDMENDFNSFAKNIFSSDPGFWELFSKYKRLNKKLNLIIKFYYSIDPQFTIEYFRKISKEN
jgi:hypothetical protein